MRVLGRWTAYPGQGDITWPGGTERTPAAGEVLDLEPIAPLDLAPARENGLRREERPPARGRLIDLWV